MINNIHKPIAAQLAIKATFSKFTALSVGVTLASASLVPAVAQAQGFALEEVVVTAQRREQNLQDVGVSVTALSSEAMARAGVEDMSRIELVTPGVTYGFVGSDAKISIRGANSNNTFADNSSIAGFFVDGVYRPRASQQTQAFFDVSRIEILKGPQGTLYGRNTFAGAVNLYTNAAKLGEFSGGLKGSMQSYGKYTTEGYLNIPASDNLAFRVAFNTKDSDGYIDNLGSGADLGQEEARNIRVSALWAPSDTFQATLRVTSLSEGGITPGIFAAEGIGQPVNAEGVTDAFGQFTNFNNPVAGTPPTRFDEPWEVSLDVDAVRDNKEDNATLHLEWALSDQLSLNSISSWTDWDSEFVYDGDWSNKPGYPYYWDEETESVTQELQLIFTGDKLTATGGLYYSKDDMAWGFSQYCFPPADPCTYADYQEVTTKTTGAFGQASFSLASNVRLIVGLRYSEEEKDTQTSYAFSALDGDGNTVPGVTDSGLTGRPIDILQYNLAPSASAVRDFDDTTYRLGVEWDLADNVLLYANTSTGFLSGGVNVDGSSFEQQQSEAYEVGIKSRLLNETLQVNAAIYRNEYTDLTTQELIILEGTNITRTVNGGEVDTMGIEAEVLWIPTPNWQISVGMSFMDNEFGSFGVANPFALANGVPQSFLALDGETPPWSPDVTMSLSVGYDINLGGGNTLTPYLQVYYSDSYNTDDVVTYSTQMQDSYTKTDFRLIWTASEKLTAELFAENLEDEAVLARTNVGGSNLVQSSYLYPRNFGVRMSYDF